MEQSVPQTSVHKIQTPGYHPKERIHAFPFLDNKQNIPFDKLTEIRR
jgi:hypothetical protein